MPKPHSMGPAWSMDTPGLVSPVTAADAQVWTSVPGVVVAAVKVVGGVQQAGCKHVGVSGYALATLFG